MDQYSIKAFQETNIVSLTLESMNVGVAPELNDMKLPLTQAIGEIGTSITNSSSSISIPDSLPVWLGVED
jgi:hypothetical protein